MKYIQLIFFTLFLYGCGVYIEYPPIGNNVQGKLIQYNDTAVYRLGKKTALIDSVVDVKSQEVFYPPDRQVFKFPASQLEPGINDVSFLFYTEGKKKRSNERLYMVSDEEPIEVQIDDYYILEHDEEAFTQGLVYWKGQLYESTGLVGQSSLRIINPDTGDLIQKVSLNSNIFAEGITEFGNKLHLLTWKDGLAYRFNEQLEQLSIHPYKQEGWGLTTLNGQMVASDGSNQLYFLSDSYKVDSIVRVFNHRGSVSYLNELECIEGDIWANVLGEDKIIVVDPTTGKVKVEIDASKCLDRNRYPNTGVLNGIAYDTENKLVFLTGKNWPFLIVWQPSIF